MMMPRQKLKKQLVLIQKARATMKSYDAKVQSYLLATIAGVLVVEIANHKSASAMWDRLSTHVHNPRNFVRPFLRKSDATKSPQTITQAPI